MGTFLRHSVNCLAIITSLPKVIWEQGRVAANVSYGAGCGFRAVRGGQAVRRGVHSWIYMLRRQRCCVRSFRRRAIVTFLLISHEPQLWSWKWLYRQKAQESSFPTIGLPKGNVKFSHTNRKHFTVGDPMLFPIVKMGNKTPQNLPFCLHDVDHI